MRSSLLIALLPLLGLAVAPLPGGPASAACAGPYLVAGDRLVLHRGATATIEGRAFVDGCQDTMTCTGVLGCESCEYDDPPPQPMSDIDLRLRQGGRTWHLGQGDADRADARLGWVTWEVELPPGVRMGRATLVPEGSQPVAIWIS